MRFTDRRQAGRKLAERLLKYAPEEPIVLGLPRGGVPVAHEVARALNAPLDVWVVRKVGHPEHPEFGLGAVAEGGVVYLNPASATALGGAQKEIQELVRRKQTEVAARVATLRGGRPAPNLTGRTVILVDDGIATGGTVRAAIYSIQAVRPAKLILAVPVAASQALRDLSALVDEVVCLHSTSQLYAVGSFYVDFRQVSDEEVVELLSPAVRS